MQACKQVLQYLQQPAAKFDLPLTQQGTAFQQGVWQAIASIPLGQVRTYGELAREIGSGPRAVANACGANNLPLLVPCHRVVAQHGLGGFMQGKENGLLIKQWLLKYEGVRLPGAKSE
jgi:methylated-DNA-[protein]-cysteine S-methyltransferase